MATKLFDLAVYMSNKRGKNSWKEITSDEGTGHDTSSFEVEIKEKTVLDRDDVLLDHDYAYLYSLKKEKKRGTNFLQTK